MNNDIQNGVALSEKGESEDETLPTTVEEQDLEHVAGGARPTIRICWGNGLYIEF